MKRILQCTCPIVWVVVLNMFSLSISFADVITPEKFRKLVAKRTADYDQMVEKRVIRFLVPYSRTFFFFDGATPKGISYEAVQQFDKFVNTREKSGTVRIHAVVLPTAREDIIPYIEAGFGDVAVGNLTITEERLQQVDFSDPMLTGVDEILVTSKQHAPLKAVEDLSGKTVHVRKSSSYYEHLQQVNAGLIKREFKPINIIVIDDNLEDEDVLEMIDAGMLPGTIVDKHKAEFWAKIFENLTLHTHVVVHGGGEIGWVVRKNNPQLKAVVNEFVKKHKKGTLLGNIIFNKYLRNTKYITNSLHSADYRRFNSLKDFFVTYGEKYEQDYLLLAALGYQESRLDQSVKSQVGAIGVMQLLPSTARDKSVNVPDITQVENNIHAGAKYLKHLADTYIPESEGINDFNRGLMALASYNAGPGKIRRLRKEAEESGLDPNVWFHNVEIVVARRVGRETVQYVSNILKYYIGYRLLEREMTQAAE